MTYAHLLTSIGYWLIALLIAVPLVRRPQAPPPAWWRWREMGRWLASWVRFAGPPAIAVPRAAIWLFAWFITSCAVDHATAHLAGYNWALLAAIHEVFAVWASVGYLAVPWREEALRQQVALHRSLNSPEQARAIVRELLSRNLPEDLT